MYLSPFLILYQKTMYIMYLTLLIDTVTYDIYISQIGFWTHSIVTCISHLTFSSSVFLALISWFCFFNLSSVFLNNFLDSSNWNDDCEVQIKTHCAVKALSHIYPTNVNIASMFKQKIIINIGSVTDLKELTCEYF